MIEYFGAFSNSDKLAIVLFLISLIAAVFISGIYFALGRGKIALSCYQKSNRIIGSHLGQISSDLSVLYDGVEIPRLTRTIAVIWNSGNTVINRGDVAQLSKLRFEMESGEKILNTAIIKYSNEVNDANISSSEKSLDLAYVSFEYLAKNEGVVIELLHTDQRSNIPLLGTIKGMKRIRNISSPLDLHFSQIRDMSFIGKDKPPKISRTTAMIVFSNIILVLGLILAATGIIYLISEAEVVMQEVSPNSDQGKVLALSGVMYILMSLFFRYIFKMPYPRTLHCMEID